MLNFAHPNTLTYTRAHVQVNVYTHTHAHTQACTQTHILRTEHIIFFIIQTVHTPSLTSNLLNTRASIWKLKLHKCTGYNKENLLS